MHIKGEKQRNMEACQVTQTIILASERQRRIAHELIEKAGDKFVLRISPPRRSLDANAKMWAMLSDVSRAKPEGRMWPPETWKCAFMHVLGHEITFAEGLDNTGPFPVGYSSSRLTVRQMADLITVIQEYGDRHGVRWTEPEPEGMT